MRKLKVPNNLSYDCFRSVFANRFCSRIVLATKNNRGLYSVRMVDAQNKNNIFLRTYLR
jgi:hypothetical protein